MQKKLKKSILDIINKTIASNSKLILESINFYDSSNIRNFGCLKVILEPSFKHSL